MAVTSRLFACDQSDLARLQSDERGSGDFQGTQPLDGVTGLHLYMIWAEIDGVEWDPDVHTGPLLRESEPWVEHVPSEMVAAFVTISDADAARIASKLAPTEDFEWEANDVLTLIQSVRAFAAAAKERCICIETTT